MRLGRPQAAFDIVEKVSQLGESEPLPAPNRKLGRISILKKVQARRRRRKDEL
jgi:hypothetical protein